MATPSSKPQRQMKSNLKPPVLWPSAFIQAVRTLLPATGTAQLTQTVTDLATAGDDLWVLQSLGHDDSATPTTYGSVRFSIRSTDQTAKSGSIHLGVTIDGDETGVSGAAIQGVSGTPGYPELQLINRHTIGDVGPAGQISFIGNDNAGDEKLYSLCESYIQDPTPDYEMADLNLSTMSEGVLLEMLALKGDDKTLRVMVPAYEDQVTHDDDIPNLKYIKDNYGLAYQRVEDGADIVTPVSVATLELSTEAENVSGLYVAVGGEVTLPATGLYLICFTGVLNVGTTPGLVELHAEKDATIDTWELIPGTKRSFTPPANRAQVYTIHAVVSCVVGEKLRFRHVGSGTESWTKDQTSYTITKMG